MGFGGDFELRTLQFRREPGQEKLGQQGDVLAAVPQWRYFQADHVQAVEQVLAKMPLPDGLFEVAVGRRNDPAVDTQGAGAAHAFEFSRLQEMQEFGLQAR